MKIKSETWKKNLLADWDKIRSAVKETLQLIGHDIPITRVDEEAADA